jgi:hypothetical protein
VSFDVTTGGGGLTNFSVSVVNMSCNPGGSISGPLQAGSEVAPIASDESFSIDYSGVGTVDPYTASFEISIQGRLSGATGFGTLTESASFDDADGTHFTCASGPLTWTATLSG